MRLLQVVVFLFAFAASTHADSQDGFWLITPEEAAMPPALPSGEHTVRITVADASGGVSQKQLTLTVQ